MQIHLIHYAMNTFANYLIEANLGIVILVVIYRILFYRETAFQFNRLLLLIGITMVLVFSVIHLEQFFIPVVQPTVLVPSTTLSETLISGKELPASTSPRIDIWKALFYLYLLGVISMGIIFITRLSRLILLICTSPSYVYKGKYRIV